MYQGKIRLTLQCNLKTGKEHTNFSNIFNEVHNCGTLKFLNKKRCLIYNNKVTVDIFNIFEYELIPDYKI